MKHEIKERLKALKSLVSSPTMLVSTFIAWMITNGHAYMLFGIGTWLNINWMKIYGGTYVAILWLPFTPEKLITIPLALFIQKKLFKRSIKK